MPNGRRQPRRLPAGEAAQLARAWAWELAAAGVYQHTRAELELALRHPAAELLEIFRGDPFSPRAGRRIGARLVEVHAVQPEALRRTILLLADGITAEPTLTEHAHHSRLSHVLAELVTGWVEAAHAQILAAQDNLRTAVDTARTTDPTRNPWFDSTDRSRSR
jgi:hypothetical protein